MNARGKRGPQRSGRDQAIDRRARARRIANLRARNAFDRQGVRDRAARLDWLRRLAGSIDATHDTDVLLRADAALLQRSPTDPQRELTFSGDDDA